MVLLVSVYFARNDAIEGVNPRLNQPYKERNARSLDSKRIIDEEPRDIVIEIDPSHITVHTADHQLSINLLGLILSI